MHAEKYHWAIYYYTTAFFHLAPDQSGSLNEATYVRCSRAGFKTCYVLCCGEPAPEIEEPIFWIPTYTALGSTFGL